MKISIAENLNFIHLKIHVYIKSKRWGLHLKSSLLKSSNLGNRYVTKMDKSYFVIVIVVVEAKPV